MPPPRGTPNPLEGPGTDTYPAIDSANADFNGKAVFISGASRGLGRAMAISFAKAGASMIAIGARSDLSTTVKEMKTAVENLGKPIPTILPVKIDVSDRESSNFGHVDIVINNAGILYASPIVDSDPDEWWKVFQVNLVGPYLITRAFMPLLQEGSGKTIINVASVGAHLKSPAFSAYQISKLAVVRFTEMIVTEYGNKGILTYTVHPGNILTDTMGDIEAVAPELEPVFVDTAELGADSLVYLTSQKRNWLAGRYINLTWALPELMEKEDEIVQDDKLKLRLVI
ncbi:NAD(P)-binding protein [Annulohypoxylon stygium]|nr:NAD(P)-binding protein [Annulohypoxylon stygium]